MGVKSVDDNLNLNICQTKQFGFWFLVCFKAWQPVNQSPESVKSNPQSLHRSGSDMFQVLQSSLSDTSIGRN